jgi:polysaccharide export outer membrane protein
MIWRRFSFRALPFAILVPLLPVVASAGAEDPPAQRAAAAVADSGTVSPYKPEPYQGYRIGPGDVLQTNVWKQPDLSVASVTVRPDGQVSLPLLDELMVQGLSPADLEQVLTKKYAEFVHQAHVTVLVREVNSQKIYLIGEVKKEGAIRLLVPMTVLQAIAEAGGLTDYAKRKKMYILRVDHGKQIIFPFDYDAVVKGQKIEQNTLVAPGDTIVAPR